MRVELIAIICPSTQLPCNFVRAAAGEIVRPRQSRQARQTTLVSDTVPPHPGAVAGTGANTGAEDFFSLRVGVTEVSEMRDARC